MIIIVLVAIVFLYQYCASQKKTSVTPSVTTPIQWPIYLAGDTVIRHTGFDLLYSERYEQAWWVAYVLTAKEVVGTVDRTDDFRPDPKVSTGTADKDDYHGSGYDRGHLAPAGDMKWSEEAMSSSFYFSNMSPQNPSFNRGIWRKLEEQVRDWAVAFDSIVVITGPKLEPGLSTIGANEVAIPNYYYKVLLVQNDTTTQAIGFWLANEKSSAELNTFAYPIDSLENWLSLDFFWTLEETLEDRVEGKVETEFWFGE